MAMSMTSASGLVVAGTQSNCGKTVVMTGLAATLAEEGFAVRAIKPICLGSRQSVRAELDFISSISRTPLDYPVHYIDGQLLNSFAWSDAVRIARSGSQPVLVELPGGCATPLCHDTGSGRWLDTSDLARQLNLPCLLVCREEMQAMEKLILNATYLIAAGLVNVIGLATVETEPEAKGTSWQEDRAIALVERTGVPYLGCLKYSPSLSVTQVNQGNLIKTTSAALDLLPIIKALNVTLSV